MKSKPFLGPDLNRHSDILFLTVFPVYFEKTIMIKGRVQRVSKFVADHGLPRLKSQEGANVGETRTYWSEDEGLFMQIYDPDVCVGAGQESGPLHLNNTHAVICTSEGDKLFLAPAGKRRDYIETKFKAWYKGTPETRCRLVEFYMRIMQRAEVPFTPFKMSERIQNLIS